MSLADRLSRRSKKQLRALALDCGIKPRKKKKKLVKDLVDAGLEPGKLIRWFRKTR